jgi:hypothetical protein
MDAIMQFVQIDDKGRPLAFDEAVISNFSHDSHDAIAPWGELAARLEKLIQIRRVATMGEMHHD